MRRLEGKSALITGAARGIGHEFAKAYIREGAKVCLADINIESALRAATDLGENAHAVFLDVREQKSIDAAVMETISHFGQIDILINNAALFSAAPLSEIQRLDYQNLFDVNVSGPLFMMQAVSKHMIDKRI